jgi:hypothetical protein
MSLGRLAAFACLLNVSSDASQFQASPIVLVAVLVLDF